MFFFLVISFTRGPVLTTFFSEGFVGIGSNFDNVYFIEKGIQIPLNAGHHQLTSNAFRWRANDGPTLNVGFVALRFFRGSGPVLLKNTLYFCDFSGGVPEPLSPPPPPHTHTPTPVFTNFSKRPEVYNNFLHKYVSVMSLLRISPIVIHLTASYVNSHVIYI